VRAGWPSVVVAKLKVATAVAGCLTAGAVGGAVALRHVAPVSERVVPATHASPTVPAQPSAHVSGAVTADSPSPTPAPRRSPSPRSPMPAPTLPPTAGEGPGGGHGHKPAHGTVVKNAAHVAAKRKGHGATVSVTATDNHGHAHSKH